MIDQPVSSIRYKLAFAYSKDSNQSAHLHSLINFLVFSLKKHWTLAWVQLSKIFERKNAIIFLSSNLNICFGCSKEPSH